MPTATSNGNEATHTVDGIFAGLDFFLAQRLPQRSNFIAQVQSNGGRVVKLEAQADFLIADHLRKDAPPGSVSFTFIEAALRDAALPDAKDHPAGPPKGEVRPVGAGAGFRSKGTRTPFTLEDDIMLYAWVQEAVAQGALAKGNELYKQLEVKNPRHPFQAWRDRYIKKQHENPNALVFRGGFTPNDLDFLLQRAHDVENIPAERQDAAWTAYSQAFPAHTPLEWSTFWRDYVRPAYLANARSPKKSSKKRKRRAEDEVNKVSESDGLPGKWEDQSPGKKKLAIAASDTANGSPVGKVRVPTDLCEQEQRPNGSTSRNLQSQAAAKPRPSTQVVELSDDEEGSETLVEPGLIGNAFAEGSIESSKAPTPPVTSDKITFRAGLDGQKESAQKHADVQFPASTLTFPTSELNRAADQPMRRESLNGKEYESNGEEEEDDNDDNDDDDDVHDKEYDSEDGSDSIQRTSSLPFPARLTAANLQSHRNGHKTPELRGIDLTMDDEMLDQSPFVEYLKEVIHRDTRPRAESNHRRHRGDKHGDIPGSNKDDALSRPDGQLDDNDVFPASDVGVNLMDYTNSPKLPPSDSDAIGAVHKSSQREVDDIGKGMLQLPASTQRSVLHNSGSPGIDTQILHPLFSDLAAIEQLDSQSIAAQSSVEYPELPQQHDVEDKDSMSSLESSPPASGRDEVRPPYKLHDVNDGDEQDDEDEVELDLTVAEPEGGFSSSPNAPGPRRAQERRLHDDEVSQLEPTAWHPIEISSQSSSSNGSSVDERERTRAQTGRVGAIDTQEILNMATQVPDLEVPLPPDSDEEDATASVNNPINRRRPRSKQLEDSTGHPSSLGWQQHDGSLFYDSDFDSNSEADRPPVRRQHASAVPPPAPSPPQHDSSSQSARDLSQTQRFVDGDDVETYMTTLNTRHGFQIDAIIAALKCTSMRPELAEIVLFDERSGRGFPGDVAGIWSEIEDAEIESGVASRLKDAEGKHGWDEVMARLEFLKEWRE